MENHEEKNNNEHVEPTKKDIFSEIDIEIKRLEKEKILNEIQSSNNKEKWEVRNFWLRLGTAVFSIVALVLTFHYTFKTDDKIVEKQKEIDQQENELVQRIKEFESRKNNILKIEENFDLKEKQLLVKDAELKLELIKERKDSLNNLIEELDSKLFKTRKSNQTLLSTEYKLKKSLEEKTVRLKYSGIDYSLQNLENQNLHKNTFENFRTILRKNNDYSIYLINQLRKKTNSESSLVRLESLYVLTFTKDSINYKKQFLDEFIKFSESLHLETTYNQNNSQLYYFFSRDSLWNVNDANYLSNGVLHALKNDFSSIENKAFLLESIMNIYNTVNHDLPLENPKIFINILKENNTLFDSNIFWTVDELAKFSTQLFLSRYLLEFNTSFCDGITEKTSLIQKFSDNIEYLDYETRENIMGSLYDLFDESEEEFEQPNSIELIKLTCTYFKQHYETNKKDIEFWVENNKLDLFIQNPKEFEKKIIAKVL